MQFKANFSAPGLQPLIQHNNKILLVGSCFTEHISARMQNAKMQILQNPCGILFNPISVCKCLQDVITNKQYSEQELFYLNEAWHSWYLHSNYSNSNKTDMLQNVNEQITKAHNFLQNTDWVIITLGSAFAYWHNTENIFVSNNHRAPQDNFTKTLLSIEQIETQLLQTINELKKINANIQILFTISPVRHLRDGLIDNNRSKARLIEAVHSLCLSQKQVQYFASYEIVMDELRDYRFYDIDFAHPNFMATEYVWLQFLKSAIEEQSHEIIRELLSINIAYKHKPQNPLSQEHRKFKRTYWAMCTELQAKLPYINLQSELEHFAD